MSDLSVGVLAGGLSRRMGTDKAFIEFEGEPLAARVVRRLEAISDDVFIVTKRPLDVGPREVSDEISEQTPLAGIITALYAAKHPHVFVCGCDMPFISNDVVLDLAGRIGDADAIAPRHDGMLQTLHTLWSAGCAEKLEEIFADGQRAVHRALEGLVTKVVDIDDQQTFLSLNTPNELAAIQPPKKRSPSRWKLSGN